MRLVNNTKKTGGKQRANGAIAGFSSPRAQLPCHVPLSVLA